MNERDYIGDRGETVFRYLITKPCKKRFWFLCTFLGEKSEAKDFSVSLIDPSCGEATFFVQVKATRRGYSGKGKNKKLRVKVAKRDILKLKRVTGPAYVAGIDIDGEVGFLHAITSTTRNRQLTGIPCIHSINCSLIPRLWAEVEAYWVARNMLAAKSMFS